MSTIIVTIVDMTLHTELDLGYFAMGLTASVAVALLLFFSSLRRKGLVWWGLAWLTVVLATMLAAVFGTSSSRVSVYFPVALGLMALYFFYLSLSPNSELSESKWRLSLMVSIGCYSFLQLVSVMFDVSFANLLAFVISGLAAMSLGVWLIKEWNKTQTGAHAVIVLMFLIAGGSLLVDIVVQRVTSAGSVFATGDFGRLPTNNFLVILFVCAFASTIARIALEFDFLNREREQKVDAERRAVQERNFNSTVSYLEQSRSISMLSATLAHELNQPITAIAANVDILLRYRGRADATNDLATSAVSDIQRDLSRTNELLDYYLSDYSEALHPDGDSDVGELIAKVLDWYLPLFNASNVSVNVQGCDAEIRVNISEVHFSQVLINIIRNSIQALGGHSVSDPRIDIVVSQTHDSVVVALSDNGPGIPSGQLEGLDKLFSSRKKDGLGLGLSISRWLLERYGGKLSIWSDVGKGFHAQLTLPRSQKS
ncbi:integral membrane sensor signal transduction histidine kinase [Aequoribacter fuscus]|uniref:histidine kinase n=1 Tax=Aequoribacter fuscus TaxID=2518989 RepID=F3L0A0_9GAMM|nr:HAMP domain-containing sensor histidine kinase [Aequoribacter fuscus]EGG30210.1 integral membrane sensor signal transduction histidine kinase [Aequoribacter fuscus]QHJ86936.1 HAMP domain-containing histidine kinase [Aequoribacter fuscus]